MLNSQVVLRFVRGAAAYFKLVQPFRLSTLPRPSTPPSSHAPRSQHVTFRVRSVGCGRPRVLTPPPDPSQNKILRFVIFSANVTVRVHPPHQQRWSVGAGGHSHCHSTARAAYLAGGGHRAALGTDGCGSSIAKSQQPQRPRLPNLNSTVTQKERPEQRDSGIGNS